MSPSKLMVLNIVYTPRLTKNVVEKNKRGCFGNVIETVTAMADSTKTQSLSPLHSLFLLLFESAVPSHHQNFNTFSLASLHSSSSSLSSSSSSWALPKHFLTRSEPTLLYLSQKTFSSSFAAMLLLWLSLKCQQNTHFLFFFIFC